MSVRPSVRPSVCWSIEVIESKSVKMSILDTLWAAAPKGRCPVGQGGISRHPFIFPSILPSVRPSFRPQVCSLRPDSGPLSPQISPFKPQFSPRELKPAPRTSNLLFWTKFCHPNFKSASGRLEIHPCVLQDIGPLGPLPCSHSTT